MMSFIAWFSFSWNEFIACQILRLLFGIIGPEVLTPNSYHWINMGYLELYPESTLEFRLRRDPFWTLLETRIHVTELFDEAYKWNEKKNTNNFLNELINNYSNNEINQKDTIIVMDNEGKGKQETK